jgi:tetratricopeptide (TPR) repeat protein
MPRNTVSPPYATAELQAREHRTNHAFVDAAVSAHQAAEIARNEGDVDAWWNMTFLQAENLLDAEDFDACAALATSLVAGGRSTGQPHVRAQAYILLAKARQGGGLLEEAATAARSAVALVDGEQDMDTDVKARQALIAALADSGRLEEAWRESLAMAESIEAEVDDQLAGKGYWVIGNVAFLCNKIQEGLQFHELAAATLSPARNLDVWAKFNKASAAMRLAADVADADTLRCIERAELATDVIGGSPNDFLLLRLNRGHWNYLAGDPQAAITLLEGVVSEGDKSLPQILGEACLLLGRSHAAMGNHDAAREHLIQAAEHFEAAGAQQRAAQARDLLASEG